MGLSDFSYKNLGTISKSQLLRNLGLEALSTKISEAELFRKLLPEASKTRSGAGPL